MSQLKRVDSAEIFPLTFRVDKLLRSNPYLTGSQILFTAKSGSVTLRGTVGTYYQKQMAQEALQSLGDVHSIVNEIEVARL